MSLNLGGNSNFAGGGGEVKFIAISSHNCNTKCVLCIHIIKCQVRSVCYVYCNLIEIIRRN